MLQLEDVDVKNSCSSTTYICIWSIAICARSYTRHSQFRQSLAVGPPVGFSAPPWPPDEKPRAAIKFWRNLKLFCLFKFYAYNINVDVVKKQFQEWVLVLGIPLTIVILSRILGFKNNRTNSYFRGWAEFHCPHPLNTPTVRPKDSLAKNHVTLPPCFSVTFAIKLEYKSVLQLSNNFI